MEQTIVHGDFTQNTMPSNSVDLVVTSPPYNLQMQYDTHADNMSENAYADFTRNWLNQCYRVLKEDGRICINIPIDTAKGMKIPISNIVLNAAQTIGFQYYFTIVWLDNHISNRTAWGSFQSASAPFVTTPCEIVIVMYKKQWKKISEGISTITKKEFIDWTKGVWEFKGESAKRIGHPAPFPVDLPERCIKLFSYEGDVVLDPFLGSGTTLVACKLFDRNGIGYDISEAYCTLAKNRVESTHKQMPMFPELM